MNRSFFIPICSLITGNKKFEISLLFCGRVVVDLVGNHEIVTHQIYNQGLI